MFECPKSWTWGSHHQSSSSKDESRKSRQKKPWYLAKVGAIGCPDALPKSFQDDEHGCRDLVPDKWIEQK
jgi:hypothetical protein